MKLLIDTKEELQDSDTAQVVFGAPFRAYLYGDEFDPSKGCIGKRTASNQRPKPCTPGMIALMDSQELIYPSEPHYIVHVDSLEFNPKTFLEYKEEIPEDVEQQTVTQKEILSRMPEESYLSYTPAQYVSEVIIADTHLIIEV